MYEFEPLSSTPVAFAAPSAEKDWLQVDGQWPGSQETGLSWYEVEIAMIS